MKKETENGSQMGKTGIRKMQKDKILFSAVMDKLHKTGRNFPVFQKFDRD
ncbi:MAG TPA: hypothetical protein H9931_10740 [Candidatus Enterocloster excrementigallinarum]|uniref:Uncharacterized protein n=1 Tax=Candidatus Enterocloster excrementigallinarum TaxID=2838558 RepID=A0A9D2PVI1_9FIRM|nr:hypothetical protein [Candidatus Enterocloster excrementigallinarum]